MTGDLLNIKEAAAYLKVSEGSLRRWTNAGILNCLRIGNKQERRFRQQDLENFVNQRVQGTMSAVRVDANQDVGSILLEGASIEFGKHICALYENDFGKLKWALPFLLDGLLEKNCCCFLIAAADTQKLILDALEEAQSGVRVATKNGQFVLSEGLADGDAMCGFIKHSISSASKSGFRSFRLLSDVSWCKRVGMSAEDMFAYEQRFEKEICRRYPIVSVCQYDVREFSGADVLNALKYHEDTFEYPISRFVSS